jgi:succinoglycan biosynthesis protein ExoV
MKIYFYSKDTNFGDAINAWIWERLLPGCLDDDERVRLSGIGSVLNGRMPRAQRWVVFTSGVGYPPLPYGFGSEIWKVIAVRGPLSAAALGLPADAAVTDGAALLAGLPEYTPLPEKERDGVVFVPHHKADPSGAWRAVAEKAGIEYLCPLADSREVISRLRRARLVLADAMHAAIIADAMRVPWVPLVTSPQISTFKWMDWTLSMDLPYAPVALPPPTLASRVENALLSIRGERYSFQARDPVQVLSRFRRSNTIRQQAWWRRAKRFGQRLAGLVDRHLQEPYLARWRRTTDDALVERSAAALSCAAAGPSYLSEDAVLRNRLETLQSRLELVRAALNGDAGPRKRMKR